MYYSWVVLCNVLFSIIHGSVHVHACRSVLHDNKQNIVSMQS